MGLNQYYEKLSKDSRVLFVRWVFILLATGLVTFGMGLYKDYRDAKKYEVLLKKMDTLEDAAGKDAIEKIIMKNEIERLKENQIKFDNLEEQYATPRVLKSLTGEVFSINNAFYRDFLEPFGFEKKDYKNDRQFWGEKVADILSQPEQMALEQKRTLTIHVNFENPFDPGKYIDRKWTVNPLKDRYGTYIAIEISVSKEYN